MVRYQAVRTNRVIRLTQVNLKTIYKFKSEIRVHRCYWRKNYRRINKKITIWPKKIVHSLKKRKNHLLIMTITLICLSSLQDTWASWVGKRWMCVNMEDSGRSLRTMCSSLRNKKSKWKNTRCSELSSRTRKKKIIPIQTKCWCLMKNGTRIKIERIKVKEVVKGTKGKGRWAE